MIGFRTKICYTSVLGELDQVSKRKILLADDSITIQKVVNLTFAEEGVEVVTVGDGDSALARVAEEWPDLIMADVNMPGANGYKVCETIRADKATQDIPVILLVGSFEPFDESEAERVGANAFLTKPFQSIRQLVAQVTELMEARPKTVAEEPDLIEAEEPVEIPTADPDNVDSLYEESLSGTVPETISADEDLGDQGFDDEMIETSVTPEDVPADTLEYGFEVVDARAIEIPVSDADAAYSHQESIEPSVEQVQPLSPLSQDEPFAGVTAEPAAEIYQPAAEAEETAYRSSEKIEELAGKNFIDPFSETVQFAAPSAETDGQEVILPETTASLAGDESKAVQDIDLLDLPPVEVEPRPIPVSAVSQVPEIGSQITSLSPELIDLIVDKVIERLRERG